MVNQRLQASLHLYYTSYARIFQPPTRKFDNILEFIPA